MNSVFSDTISIIVFNATWRFLVDGPIYSSLAIGNDETIYVTSADDKLYALGNNGLLKWSYTTSRDIISSPSIGNNGIIYFVQPNGNLCALDSAGNLRWQFFVGGMGQSSPTVDMSGNVYVGGNNIFYIINSAGTEV